VELLKDRSVPSTSPIDVLGHLSAAECNQFIPNAKGLKGSTCVCGVERSWSLF
jgi:hypothetical protein